MWESYLTKFKMPPMIKVLEKLGMARTHFNKTKTTLDKPIANVIPSTGN